MRSKLQRRIISLLAIVAFSATAAADAYGLHSCPHHDAPAETSHQHHTHAGAETAPPPADHDGHGPCSCVGECSTNPPTAPLETAPVTPVAPLRTSSAVVPTQVQPHACTTPYLLPWANAPPVSASR